MIGSRAHDDAIFASVVTTTVGEGLDRGRHPVVVGSRTGLGTLGEGAIRVGNLVADQGCGALGLDVSPSEVVPGARVLPVRDIEVFRLNLCL